VNKYSQIKKCHSFCGKIEMLPNSPDLKCVGPMLGHYQKYTPKQPTIAELKTALLSIWNDLPQEFIDN